MLTNVEYIELLLRLIQSINVKETDFKKKLYNKIFFSLNVYNPKPTFKNESGKLAIFIIKQIGITFNLEDNYFKIRSRVGDLPVARQIGMYFIKKNTNLKLWQIGNLYDRDHATVLHGIKTVGNFMEVDSSFMSLIQKIGKRINLKY